MNNTKEEVKSVSLVCEHCGGTLTIDEGREILACPFCGNKTLIVENDAVTIEKIRTAANKEIELEKIKSNDRHMQMEEDREAKKEKKEQVEKFKKGKLSKFLLIAVIVSAICAFVSFSNGKILAGILLVVEVGCFGVAWAMGMQLIKEKKRYLHVLIAIIGVILIVPTFRACTAEKEEVVEEIEWNILEMGNKIPEPESAKIKITSNSKERLSIDVYEMTENDCYAYVKECEDEFGYNIDVDKVGSSFWAYNAEGYKIHVSHISDYMSITLESPITFEKYEIPEYAISNGLPLPESEMGHYEWKYEDNFNIKIGNTSVEEYKEYVSKCMDAGFTIESQEGNDFYNGRNENGYKLSVNYLGYNIMSIDFDSPKAEEAESTPVPEKEEEITKTPEIPDIDISDINVGTVDPEFKAMMDSYEAFFDEYIEFMNAYANADSMEILNMLENYTTYLEQYTETMSKLGEIDQGELSAADALYYTEVTMRIYEKMAGIGE